jgi:DNA-binding transcriptional MerR regulator
MSRAHKEPASQRIRPCKKASAVLHFLGEPIDQDASSFQVAERIQARLQRLERKIATLQKANALVCEQRDKAIHERDTAITQLRQLRAKANNLARRTLPGQSTVSTSSTSSTTSPTQTTATNLSREV